jgi:hypothetical protein
MNLTDYVKKMKATIDRDAVIDAQNNTLQELRDKTIPLYATAESAWKMRGLKSKQALGFEDKYRRMIGLRSGNMFGDIRTRLENIRTNMEFINQESIKTLTPTIMRDNITAQQATLLQMTDCVGFVSRMARRLLDAIVVYESAATGKFGKDYLSDNMTKGEAAFIESRFPQFITFLETVGAEPKVFKKKFENIPDMVVDPEAGIIDSLFPATVLDPFRMGFLASPFNPLFLIGKWWGEYQVMRYKEAKIDLERTQSRIFLLEELLDGKGDPAREAEIELLQDKVSRTTAEINKFEESLK